LTGAALLCVVAACVAGLLFWPDLDGGDLPAEDPPTGASLAVGSPTDTAPPPGWVGDATPAATLTAAASNPTSTPRPVTGGDSEVVVSNRSPYDLCYVYISPVDSETWGENWLASDAVIMSGESRIFVVPGGLHDLLVRTCVDEAAAYTAWDFSGSQTFQVGDTGLVPIQVINGLAADICYVYISPPEADEWGEDWLASTEVIVPNDARVFFVEPGVYDMLARDCDGNILAETYGFDAAAEYWAVSQSESEP
jgi:hypothetical protein